MLSKIAKSAGSSKAKMSKNAGKAKSKTGKAKVSKPLVKVVDKKLELPLVVYKLTIKEMMDIWSEYKPEGDSKDPISVSNPSFLDINVCLTPEKVFSMFGSSPEALGPVITAKILTLLREHEDQSVVSPIEELEEEVSTEHLTAQPYDEKEMYALFFLYEEDCYRYIKIKISASTIKKAGMGIYALEDIPDGAIGQYKGIPRCEDETNMYYAWVVKSFDPLEGLPDDSDTYMYYIDATDFERSNWTRYVNCGMKEVDNNMDQEQVYDKIFYTTTRDIAAGEELFVDYGEEYRIWNFGMEEGSY